jgi:hypothetical protein
LAVFHARIASPPDVTGRLVQTLTADPGVLNLVVSRGAARRPDGDAVQFDLRTGSANPVFRQLRDLQLDGRGVVMVETVDATLNGPERRAFGQGRYLGEVAPAWEMVEAGIRSRGVYAPSFFGLLIIAGLIACVGILTNSQILAVGAMVAVVAVLAGLVGVVSLTEARAGALIGVFISVTTIPAAAALGLSLAYQDWTSDGGSAEQLLLNVVLLIVVGVIALRVQRVIWRSRGG